ncbi:MAG: InlB B-repeat-containing protein, partial [Dehalococcoidia bacterium]|nr:InlB B-repeat-containing protein [Dehalococcoidia bacterium]
VITFNATADIKAYSEGNLPAIHASNNNAGNGYYVNAMLDNPISSTASRTLKVYNNNSETNTLTLPAGFRAFGYSTGAVLTQNDNIHAYNNTTLLGIIVRKADNNALIYSIKTLGGYNAHNSNAGDGVLPVKFEEYFSVQVTFDKNTTDTSVVGPTPDSKTVLFNMAYGNLASISRTGYNFDGWYTATSGGSLVTDITNVSNPAAHTLYAHWTAKSGILVTFDKNTSDSVIGPTPPSKTVTFDATYGTLATVSRTGYDFVGWYTEVVDGSLVTASTTVTNDENHTLYAHWSVKTDIVVTFNKNTSGTVTGPTPSSITVTFGAAYGTLSSISRIGYTFDGWYTAASGGNLVEDTTTVTNAENHTLYAHWTVKSGIVVTFDPNGGNTPSPTSISVIFDAAYGSLATVTRTGYNFDGWYTAASGGTKITDTSIVSNAENHTLYAHWSAKDDIVVSFNSNGGNTPSMASKTVTFDAAYGSLATVTRTGYNFDGWYTAASGGTKITDASIVSNAENHTLYAHWTANDIVVTFDSNGSGTPSPTSKTVTFDAPYGDLANISLTGYKFDGWYTAATGGDLVTEGTIVTNAENHTLYAHWSVIGDITVTFNKNTTGVVTGPDPASKMVTFGVAYGSLASISRIGYTFGGWFTDAACTTGNEITSASPVTNASAHTLYAKWTAKSGIVVTFDSNGGNTPSPASKTVTFDADYGSLATISRTGYNFDGWYTAATGGSLVTSTTKVSNPDNHTLYAHWTAKNDIVVSFDSNGGDGPTPTAKSVTFDSLYGTLANVSRYGYNFTGWYTAASGGSLVDDTTTVTNPDNHTLYAHWSAKNDIVVEFNAGGGNTPSPEYKLVSFGAAYSTLASVSRTGYNFEGWYTAAIGGTLVSASTTVTRAENHILYAHWSAKSNIVVSFNSNGGSTPSPTSKTVTFDAAYGSLATVFRTGYTFIGWFDAQTGGNLVGAATIVSIPDNHTLYAYWSQDIPSSVTVTFDSNGGSPAVPPYKAVVTGESYGTLASATRYGYTFDGWYTMANGGSLVTDSTVVGASTNHTLYAHWTPVSGIIVSFDSNSGDTASPEYKTVTYGVAYGALATATRTGYTFRGWFDAPIGGTQISTTTIVTNAASHTLYAHWTAKNDIVVSFNSNGGGTPSVASKTVTFDSPYGTLATVYRDGYEFLGWFTSASGGTLVATTTLVSNPSNHTLYAHWSAKNDIVVTFDPNGGNTPSIASIDVVFGSAYGTLATVARYGYTFDGWYTDQVGGTLIGSTSIVSISSSHTLFAHWSAKNNIVVSFNSNGGSIPSPASKTVTFDRPYDTLPTVLRAGYTFMGWFTDQTGGALVTAATIVSNADNHTLYAHWAPRDDIVVTFDKNTTDASVSPNPASMLVSFNSAYGMLASISRTGYTFLGWFDAQTGGNLISSTSIVSNPNNHTLYAHWALKSGIVVTFDKNTTDTSVADPTPASITVTFGAAYGTLPGISRAGYTFDGWYTAATGGSLVTATTVVAETDDHTLYAHWSVKNIVVTFNTNGGNAPSPASKTVIYGSAYGALATTSRTGYTFDGWYTAASGGTLVTADTVVTNQSDHTLYAHWRAISGIVVTFNSNGGSTPSPASKTVTYGAAYGALATVTRTGYIFTGWYTAASGGSLVTASTVVSNANNHTLYAQWVQDSVKSIVITFDANTEDPTVVGPIPTSKIVYFGVLYIAPYGDLATISRPGYTFGGWYLSADCTGAEITASTVVATQSDHILYAKWVPNNNISYVVHYYLAGTTTQVAPDKVVNNRTMGESVTENAITITGYTAVAPTSVTKVLAASGNEFIFYYTQNVVQPTRYTVTVEDSAASPNGSGSYEAGVTVTINAGVRDGYTFTGWTVVSGGVSVANSATASFTMPARDVVVRANWEATAATQPPPTSPQPPPTSGITTPPATTDESSGSKWALLNLILCCIGAAAAVLTLARVFIQKNKKTNLFWLLAAIVAGIAGVVVFLLTGDMKNPMTFVDLWTIVNAVILILGSVGAALTIKHHKNKERHHS